jgi:hypothetical protein
MGPAPAGGSHAGAHMNDVVADPYDPVHSGLIEPGGAGGAGDGGPEAAGRWPIGARTVHASHLMGVGIDRVRRTTSGWQRGDRVLKQGLLVIP